MNPRSTDYNVDALTTTPSRRLEKVAEGNTLSQPITAALCRLYSITIKCKKEERNNKKMSTAEIMSFNTNSEKMWRLKTRRVIKNDHEIGKSKIF